MARRRASHRPLVLPFSVNRVYSGAVPVVPGDIADMMGCIVRGAHGIIPLQLPAHAFRDIALTGSIASGVWVGTGEYIASLPLFEGNRIHKVEFGIDPSNAGQLELRIRRTNISTGVTAVAILATTGGGGGGHALVPFTEADIITALGWSTVPANESVTLEVELGTSGSGVAQKLAGAVIEISKP